MRISRFSFDIPQALAHHGGDKGKHGNHSDWIAKIPGCEAAASVEKIKASECCNPLPSVFSKDAYEKCDSTCEKSNDFCCKDTCALKNYDLLDAAGKFDVAKTKAFLKKAINNAAWVSRWTFFKIRNKFYFGFAGYRQSC